MPVWTGTNGSDYFNAYLQGANQSWTAYGYGGNDQLIANGWDILYGGSGDDLLTGFGSYNWLYGESGNDVLESVGASFSYLSGGSGNDTYTIDTATPIIFEAASAGTDTVLLVGSSISEYYLPANVENVKASGTHFLYPLNSYRTVINNSTQTIHGNELSNTITANNLNNTLNGNDGNDVIFGKDGYDTLNGGDGSDILFGGNDQDLLDGGNGNDFLYGGNDSDQIIGGVGNDVLVGYDSSSTSDSEFDYLTGGAGADFFHLGNNAMAYYLGSDYAVISDFDWSEGDKFYVFGSESDYTLTTSSSSASIFYQGDLIAYVGNTNDVIISEDFVFLS